MRSLLRLAIEIFGINPGSPARIGFPLLPGFLALMALSAPVAYGFIHVNRAATGANNGSSWTDAYTDLNQALQAASVGERILVAQGVYKPTTGTDRSISFRAKINQFIEGGYAGTGANPYARDIQAYETVLSGNIGDPASAADNSETVLLGDIDIKLDGLTIADGNAWAISHESGTAFYGTGGGLYVKGGGRFVIDNCKFRDNHAERGGGAISMPRAQNTVWLSTSAFESNSTGSTAEGGAIFLGSSDAGLFIEGVRFEGNTAGFGGALAIKSVGFPLLSEIAGCRFIGNSAGAAGALYLVGSVTNLRGCLFENNRATSGGGGAILARNLTYNANLRVFNGIFRSNSASTWGGGVTAVEGSEVELVNCLFDRNSARVGGAITAISATRITLLSNLLVGNTAMETGGGIHHHNTRLQIYSSIVWNNTAALGGNELHLSHTPAMASEISHSDVKGGIRGSGVMEQNGQIQDLGGNLATDPLFVSATDFRLRAASTLVDAGQPSPDLSRYRPWVHGSGAVDLDDLARVAGTRIDIGPYEFGSSNPGYVITANATGCGGISPSGQITVAAGASQSFQIRDGAGCELERVLVDGLENEKAMVDRAFVFVNVQANHFISAQFRDCQVRDIVPNHMVVNEYATEGGAPVTTYLIPDGFGGTAESQLDLGGGDFLVSATYRDALGNETEAVKPFVVSQGGPYKYVDMACRNCIKEANRYFNGTGGAPDAGNFAYSAVRYEADPLSRAVATGSPGSPYSLEGRPNKKWFFGVASKDDFVPGAGLNAAALDARASVENASYFLTVVSDPNGQFGQSMRDKFGNTVKVWSNPDLGNDARKLLTERTFDVFGRMVEETPPAGQAFRSEYVYNTSGQLLSQRTPDQGLIEYRYELGGKPRFVKTPLHRVLDDAPDPIDHYLIYSYDALDRLVAISENRSSHSFDSPDAAVGDSVIKVRNIFDGISAAELKALGLGVSDALIDLMAGELHSRPGFLSASVAYDESGNKIAADLYSYGPQERLESRYKIIPAEMPVQKFTFSYDLQGKVLEEDYYNGYDFASSSWRFENIRSYQYNALQKTEGVNQDGVDWTAYAYSKTGELKEERIFPAGTSVPAEILSYEYNIRNWVTKIDAVSDAPLFTSLVDYANRFNGHMSGNQLTYHLPGAPLQSFRLDYAYDGVNRLTSIASADARFASQYAYDPMGRLERKKEGSQDRSSYQYPAGSNRLTHIAAGDPDRSNPNTFVYDPNGNLVFDRSKEMTVDYDWRGLPVNFRFYASVPAGAVTWEDVKDNGLQIKKGMTLIKSVSVIRDVQGRKVLVSVLTPAGTRSTAFVDDFAVFERAAGATGPLVLKEINYHTPKGLRGRKDVAGNGEYFYAPDQLGSIRAVVDGNGDMKGAFMYQGYGSAEGLLVPAEDPFREKFGGKSADENSGLYEFDARYLDPEVGIWLAADPAEQNFNGYGFVGGNPANRTDPLGLHYADESADDGRWVPSWNPDWGANYSNGQKPNPYQDAVNQAAMQDALRRAAEANAKAVRRRIAAEVQRQGDITGDLGSRNKPVPRRSEPMISETPYDLFRDIHWAVYKFDPYFLPILLPASRQEAYMQLALGAGGLGAKYAVQAFAKTSLLRSAVISDETAVRFMMENGKDIDQALGYLHSFDGPITARVVEPGEKFLRYADVPGSKGSFLSKTMYETPLEAVDGLYLRPYGNNATRTQVVTATGRSIVLEGRVKNGTTSQSLIIQRGPWQFTDVPP